MNPTPNVLSINNYPLTSKAILLRVDYNCPIKNKKIENNQKIIATLPTINYLLEQNCKIIIATHLGRPQGKIVEELRTKILAKELSTLLPKTKVTYTPDCIGKNVTLKIQKAQPSEILVLENLRFHPEEEENDDFFAHSLSQLAQVYINDAFSVSHRAHASVVAITKYLPSLAGFLLEKEIRELSLAIHPQNPSVWILGGAKLDKIDLIKSALEKADYVLLGGALPFTFLRATKKEVGMSKFDATALPKIKEILNSKHAHKLILPIDFIVANKFSAKAKTHIRNTPEIEPLDIGLDLGPQTIKLYKMYLRKAHTIVWNGPLGYFEWPKFSHSTKEIATFLGTLTATSICGGGETAQALEKFHLTHKVSYISTSGGAAIEFLEGKKLPGIAALENSRKLCR